MAKETYLDHGSASPIVEPARRAFLDALDAFGDPLRLHQQGRAARRLLDDSRATIAEGIGAQPDEIVFTSGGTESVALAIWGGVRPVREIGHRIVTSAVEHPAVGGVTHTLESDGFVVAMVPVDGFARVDLDAFATEVRRPGTVLASLQHANHEVGTMQPIAEAARLCREAGVLFHTDACQTVGKLPIDVGMLEVDLLSLSAHKFGGPPGIGALFVRRGTALAPYPCGDDRERKRRSGMENIPGAAAMAAALESSLTGAVDRAARTWALTGRLRDSLESISGVRVYGHPTQRVPHLACFSISDLDAEILAMTLDDRGFRLSVGSNCSGVTNEASPVLEHMGVPDTPSFRIGVGPETTDADVDRLIAALPGMIEELRRVETATEEAMARYRPASTGES
jgi:cysteine desulfurase